MYIDISLRRKASSRFVNYRPTYYRVTEIKLESESLPDKQRAVSLPDALPGSF